MAHIIDVFDEKSVRALAQLRGSALLKAIRQQSQPRRFPWQPKTLRDLIDDQSAELVAMAEERSKALADALSHEHDRLERLAKQSRPRRFPWQAKTIHDHASEQAARIAAMAAEQGKALAELAAQRRAAGTAVLQRELHARRFPWQPKTLRDRYDTGQETARNTAHTIKKATGTALAQAQTVAEQANAYVKELSGASASLGATATTASDKIKEAAGTLSTRVSETSDAVGAALRMPGDAINTNVAAGKRRVRRGVRLVRTAFWSFLLGVGAGILVAPRSGAEIRRKIQSTAAPVYELGRRFSS